MQLYFLKVIRISRWRANAIVSAVMLPIRFAATDSSVKNRKCVIFQLIVTKMALASVLQGECADFSGRSDRSFVFGCGLDRTELGFASEAGDGPTFAVKSDLYTETEEGPERKIEFLHGTTTLAFKVSPRCRTIIILLRY